MNNKHYRAEGVVLGNCWGGGSGAYASEAITADTKEKLLRVAEDMLQGGTLDAGMGFESLMGAVLPVTETETITQNNKEYHAEKTEVVYIGKLTEEQKEFLEEYLYSM